MRPTSLIRSDSNVPEFSAPAVNIRDDAIDCGIKSLGRCCLPRWFHRFATPNWFLVFFIILAIVQGSTEAYFQATARHIGDIFGYSETLIDWLLVSHDLFMGLFVFFIAFFGNKIHRPAWLGGIACLQGVTCLMIFVPYLEYRGRNETSIIKDPVSNLCKDESVKFFNLELVEVIDFDWITIVVLFVAQLFTGLGNASFFSHGFSYMDDNVDQSHSLIYIALGLAIRLSTIQYGSFMAWSLLDNGGTKWWIGYCINGCLLIFVGTMVTLFPQRLMGTVIKDTAASILDNASRASGDMSTIPNLKPDHHFGRTLKRLFTNRVLVVNTLAIVLMLTSMYNFAWYEGKFMESQFYLPNVGIGFDDPWKSRLWKNISKPPIMFLMILVSGLIITYSQPGPRKIILWNVITTTAVACIYFSYGFIDCNKGGIVSTYKNHMTTPYCSFLCNCADNTKFEPVCTQDVHSTYYSPCHAGCKDVLYINEVKVYGNCSCVSDYNRLNKISTIAMQGACDNAECAKQWIVFQSLTVLSAALLGSGFLGSFFINLRSVYSVDKAMGIAYQFFFIGTHIHFPMKLLYKSIADANCQYYNDRAQRCNLYNDSFGDYITIMTACFLLVSAVLYTVVVFLVKDVQLFETDDFKYPDTPIPLDHRPRTGFSTPSTVELEPSLRYARPRRPPRSSESTSQGSTVVNSIDYRSPEVTPLIRNQLEVVGELKHLTGTAV